MNPMTFSFQNRGTSISLICVLDLMVEKAYTERRETAGKQVEEDRGLTPENLLKKLTGWWLNQPI